ncbi:MAG TPA: hypothetical protein VGK73_15085 [Polyangiaceae bacterium]
MQRLYPKTIHRLGTPNPEALQRYQVLPANEFAALEAWLSQFYDFQLEWLLESSDYAICNKARQIGLSHTGSATGVLWGAFHGELTTIISVGELESGEVLDKARKHASILQRLGSRMAATGKRDNATELSFASGGRILALPSTGGRSFSGNVFLDEFAYQERAGKVWDAAAAVTALGGRLRVISTPNGVGNDFHSLWRASGSPAFGWNRHEIPIEVAQAQRYPLDLQKCWTLAKGDPRIFDQLFHCKFLDNELQYIPGELIAAASPDDAAPADGPHFGGLDIGKSVDLTVLTVLRKHAGQFWLVYVETCRRTSSDLLDAMVGRAFAKFQLRKLGVDATGLGAFPAERMAKKHGLSKVEPINFTQQSKEELATGLFQRFAEHQIRIPKTRFAEAPTESPEAVREDIAAIRRIITPAGNVRYDAPHTDTGHADRAWSFALAVNVAANAPTYATL